MQVPVQVCRMVTEQQVRQVPVQVCRMVQEECVRKVPYTTCRQVVERVPRQVAGAGLPHGDAKSRSARCR